MKIKVVRTNPNIDIPKRRSNGEAGFDLQAAIDKPFILYPGQSHLVKTGLKIHIDNTGVVGFILPRSGKGSQGLVVGNLTGVIDSTYQGEWMVSLWNRSDYEQFTIEPGERIAQVVFLRLAEHIEFDEVAQFDGISSRGENGFGSSDV
jgi:dUTP pyrophosphatase